MSTEPNFGLINLWTRSLAPEDIDHLIEANGNLPGDLMSFVFSMMTPLNNLTKYNLGLSDVMDDDKKLLNFLRMEKWLADRPDHPGEAAKQWLKDLYQENKLVKNEFELSGRRIDLRNIRMPVLNVFAKDDHIIPPRCSKALASLVRTQDYTEIPPAWGACGRLRQWQVPRHPRDRYRGMVAQAVHGFLFDITLTVGR